MKLPFLVSPELPDLVAKALDNIRSLLQQTQSWEMRIVDEASDLPSPALWQGRQIIVRDIDGAGNTGIATALDGAWYDQNWSAL